MLKLIKRLVILVVIVVLAIIIVSKSKESRRDKYHSIWEDIYGRTPPYMDRIDEMKVN